MLIIYMLLSILLAYVSIKVMKRKVNPITIYITSWTVMILLYEIKLVKYYKIEFFTWIVILLFMISFSIGVLLAYRFTSKKHHQILRRNNQDQKILFYAIIVLIIISSLAIVPNFFIMIKTYGFMFFKKISSMYHDRLSGTGPWYVPYFGSFVHLAVIFSIIYFVRYGWNHLLILPVFLLIARVIPTGGSGDFVLAALYLFFPIAFRVDSGKLKIKKRYIAIMFSLLILVFFIINLSRSSWITPNEHMSEIMVKLIEINPIFYKIYTYVSSPIGVLNEYLKEPSYQFGGNTFNFLISFLNKFGMNLNYSRYQEFYYIPIHINVGTFVRELIQDFTIIPAIFITWFFAYMVGMSFTKFILTDDILSEAFSIIFASVIFMGFFVWYYRETSTWFITLAVYPLLRLVDSRIKTEDIEAFYDN